jgi:hypothetical protein
MFRKMILRGLRDSIMGKKTRPGKKPPESHVSAGDFFTAETVAYEAWDAQTELCVSCPTR